MNFCELFSVDILLQYRGNTSKRPTISAALGSRASNSGSNPGDRSEKSMEKKKKSEHPKCPETVDASGFAPDASILL